MSKRGRAKKKRKQQQQQQQRRISRQPANTTETTHPVPAAAQLRSDKETVKVSNRLTVRAPVEHCFDILAKQLEEPPNWDPMVVDVKPLSPRRRQARATSLVTFRLGRKEVKTLAMISSYQPNRFIAWVSSDRPRVSEDWTLEPGPDGTTVTVTLGYDAPRSFVSSLIDRFMWRQVEQAINQMLGKFREFAESSSNRPNNYKE
jgi:uncharacterized membrane protein